MRRAVKPPPLPLLAPGGPFPPPHQAWPEGSPAPGLLAVGGCLDAPTLLRAYGQGIFPWFGPDEPLLWWCPPRRMVLHTARFRLHRSLRQALRRFARTPGCELRFDSAFAQVMAECASVPRPGQSGTWIVPAMQAAYTELHRQGHAHSVEVWADGQLAAGLYCVNIGRAVFGESMFTRVRDGSKMALAALVAFCRAQGLPLIDCQQNTGHLAFMGAAEMPSADFVAQVRDLAAQPAPRWMFQSVYWDTLLTPADPRAL